MTPAQKRRAQRRKCLQRKRPPEIRVFRKGHRVIGERLTTGNPSETINDALKLGDAW